MFYDDVSTLSAPLVQAIEDAILLGNVKEIDGVLDLVRDDESFPQDLRYGLEALRYYRLYYGKGGDLEPKTSEDKSRMLQMEAYWGRELIEQIANCPDLGDVKIA